MSTALLISNLQSPVVLAFALGFVARLLRSDLAIPAQIQSYLSIFLLFAIGMKGGVALRGDAPEQMLLLLIVTITAGILTGLSAYGFAKLWLGDNKLDAASMAAHFGSASAVTFIAAQQYVEQAGTPADAVLVALLVALEIPAILLGIVLAKGQQGVRWHDVREVLFGKTAMLLLGGMAIGALTSKSGVKSIDAMYFELFQGMLMLFMLDIGGVAAEQLKTVGRELFRLASYAIALPILHGLFGVCIGHYIADMNVGTMTVFATMIASASYIAAPASIRAALPEANVGRSVTAALGFTFPFNLAVGIPLYAGFAGWLVR
jgi:uncharacterized protein